MISIGVLGVGSPKYRIAAWQTALISSKKSNFEVFLGIDVGVDGGIKEVELPFELVQLNNGRGNFRAQPFLQKFELWREMLNRSNAEILIHLDADAVMVKELTAEAVKKVLGDFDLGMVEQGQIIGESKFGKIELYQHYLHHTHRYIAPELDPPLLDDFTFFNSGVVIFRRAELERFLDWFGSVSVKLDGTYSLGEHMIADQDFLQIWANEIRPSGSTKLPPAFNHSPLWHVDYPSRESQIIHLSNFCNGPTSESIQQLARLAIAGIAGTRRFDDLSIILVTHNSSRIIGESLKWLESLMGAEVIVVDNASKDSTLNICETADVKIHRLSKNLGFATAANIGAKLATRRYLVFLNPDCFLTYQCADEAITELDRDPERILTPLLLGGDNEIYPGVQPGYTEAKLTIEMVEGDDSFFGKGVRKRYAKNAHDQSWKWALGTCLFIAKSEFETIGGFDESYFLYMEDVEFGNRATGALSHSNLKSLVFHIGGSSTQVSDLRRVRHLLNARLQYAEIHYGLDFASRLRSMNRISRLLRMIRVPF